MTNNKLGTQQITTASFVESSQSKYGRVKWRNLSVKRGHPTSLISGYRVQYTHHWGLHQAVSPNGKTQKVG